MRHQKCRQFSDWKAVAALDGYTNQRYNINDGYSVYCIGKTAETAYIPLFVGFTRDCRGADAALVRIKRRQLNNASSMDWI
jgi:hypothetical protein